MSFKNDPNSYFSVSFDLILLNTSLPYDLFVNSSTHAKRERFVRIFPKGGSLQSEDLANFKEKYYQLYVLEDQRENYLRSLGKTSASDVEKTKFIKESAIYYLEKLFDPNRPWNTDYLADTINSCRESVESMVDVIQKYDIGEVRDLIAKLSFHDFYTYDHSINVAMYSISILNSIKKNASRIELVTSGLGGLLHDLGKLKIPTSIINNPGKLSPEDFAIIKKHPEFGGELMSEHDFNVNDIDFEIIKRVITEHHENINGTGYPKKLKDKEIHIFARITAIADFFDAITTKRSYHEVLSTEDALEVMARSVGRKIDGKIFDVFCENVGQIVLSGRSHMELPDDFDCCQPHEVLPLEKARPKVQRTDFIEKDEKDFGKVKIGHKKRAS